MSHHDSNGPEKAVQTAYEALATGRLRYPSGVSPLDAVLELAKLVRQCAVAIERFRHQHPAAVTSERFAPGAVGVFNRLALARGAMQAGLNLHDILLVGCLVRDSAPPLPDHPDPRPMGQRVMRLFTPSDADVCIDGEILALADELEFGTLVEMKGHEGTANKHAGYTVTEGTFLIPDNWRHPAGKPANASMGQSRRSQKSKQESDRLAMNLIQEEPELLDSIRELAKRIGRSWAFTKSLPSVQKAADDRKEAMRRRLERPLTKKMLVAIPDGEDSDAALRALAIEELELSQQADLASQRRKNVVRR